MISLVCKRDGNAISKGKIYLNVKPAKNTFVVVEKFLDNPVYHALLSGDADKAIGPGPVKYFEKEISPFAGFDEKYIAGFEDLYKLLTPGRLILYAIRREINIPAGWKLIHHILGTQFIFSGGKIFETNVEKIVPLTAQDAVQMVALAKLTKPGPFDKRTIEFGNYFGIFDNNRLVAMTGQRLHVYGYTEVSAVCTHPDYLGRGYARTLLEHQVDEILRAGKIPFLHVRSDNERAIGLYEKSGFKANGQMNFYFLER